MRLYPRSLAVGCCLFLASCGAFVRAQSLRIAAASDLRWALEEVGTAFQKQHSVKLQVTYGSSGNFHAQLLNQAPFDLFLSADIDYPKDLVRRGLGVQDSLFVYGIGRIVLWVPKASPIPVEKLGFSALRQPSVRKVALANPKHAPYGRAAEAALREAGLWDGLKDKLVLGENIAQTAQFVQVGGADIGLIALSLVLAGPMKDQGRWWLVPAEDHPTLEQGGVILAWARDLRAARSFRDFLVSPEGTRILTNYGFSRQAQ